MGRVHAQGVLFIGIWLLVTLFLLHGSNFLAMISFILVSLLLSHQVCQFSASSCRDFWRKSFFPCSILWISTYYLYVNKISIYCHLPFLKRSSLACHFTKFTWYFLEIIQNMKRRWALLVLDVPHVWVTNVHVCGVLRFSVMQFLGNSFFSLSFFFLL